MSLIFKLLQLKEENPWEEAVLAWSPAGCCTGCGSASRTLALSAPRAGVMGSPAQLRSTLREPADSGAVTEVLVLTFLLPFALGTSDSQSWESWTCFHCQHVLMITPNASCRYWGEGVLILLASGTEGRPRTKWTRIESQLRKAFLLVPEPLPKAPLTHPLGMKYPACSLTWFFCLDCGLCPHHIQKRCGLHGSSPANTEAPASLLLNALLACVPWDSWKVCGASVLQTVCASFSLFSGRGSDQDHT